MADFDILINGCSYAGAVGQKLLDLCERENAPVPFSCRGGSCGTCVVRVLEGGENLSAMTDNEAIILPDIAEDRDDLRLACQVTVHGPVNVAVYEE